MKTEERIVTRALELFNEKGIEYVGMRELAASLDTKLGNITYYFPTKEDLIARLAMDLSTLNSAILQEDENITIQSYLVMTSRHFENQFRYRCMFISFVHLMYQYEKLAIRYKKTEEHRRRSGKTMIANLVVNKFLKELTENELAHVASSIVFIARFWISEAAISHSKLKPADQINHYVKMLANMLSNYCTPKGKAQIADFIG